MSCRLTPNWTPSSTEAFGSFGQIGDRAEEIAHGVYEHRGYQLIRRACDYQKQILGIDLSGTDPSGRIVKIDVKGNVRNGVLYLELEKNGKAGWLLDQTKTYTHVCHVDLGQPCVIWQYKRVHMLQHYYTNYDILKRQECRRGQDVLLKLSLSTFKALPFVKEVSLPTNVRWVN